MATTRALIPVPSLCSSSNIVCFLYLCMETMIVYIALAKYVFNWSDEEKKVVQNKPFILARPDVGGKSDSL